MAELRAYYYNNGDMMELIMEQKKPVKMAVGAEDFVLSADKVIDRSVERQHGELGKYLECIHHSVSQSIKKKVWFNSNIWGL